MANALLHKVRTELPGEAAQSGVAREESGEMGSSNLAKAGSPYRSRG
jgi:hypothetical protein